MKMLVDTNTAGCTPHTQNLYFMKQLKLLKAYYNPQPTIFVL